jgi:hypothetical protein
MTAPSAAFRPVWAPAVAAPTIAPPVAPMMPPFAVVSAQPESSATASSPAAIVREPPRVITRYLLPDALSRVSTC